MSPGDSNVDRAAPEFTTSLKAWPLFALVFISGGVLMGLEIVGARTLWNNFGSSVFVWGSILSVFMGALAGGYYVGGRVADRHPEVRWLLGIVAVAGLLILILAHIAAPICNSIDDLELGLRMGPLVASMVLYFVPSFLMGAVSPFAVRLQARVLATMGNVAGTLYALSTAGSLVGTLLTTFVLIPMLGTTSILHALGALQISTALLVAIAYGTGARSRSGNAALGLFVLVAAWVSYPGELWGSLSAAVSLELTNDDQVREFLIAPQRESAYHTVSVVGRYHSRFDEGVQEHDGFARDPDAQLQMRFNNFVQSSLYANRDGFPPATTYTKMLHLGMVARPDATRVLVIGLGGGSVPRELVELYGAQRLQVDAVEIDPVVVAAARAHFHYDDDERIATYVADGRQFVRRGWGRFPLYDVIILDAFSGGGQVPAHLLTQEFFEQCLARLTPEGVLTANVTSALAGQRGRFLWSLIRTLRRSFGTVRGFPLSVLQPDLGRTVILVASRQPDRRSPQQWHAAAEQLVARVPGLAARTTHPFEEGSLEVFTRLQLADDARRFEDALIFTDDYAPVETMHWGG